MDEWQKIKTAIFKISRFCIFPFWTKKVCLRFLNFTLVFEIWLFFWNHVLKIATLNFKIQ